MTRDETIKLMHEAGVSPNLGAHRFAALVAAAEREACAKECEAHVTGLIPVTKAAHGYHDAMRAAAAAIRARSAK